MKTFTLSFRFKTIMLFCILSTFTTITFGQNWRSISTTDTTLFKVSDTNPTPIWNNYLRGIWIDSTISITNGVQHYFYPSVRLDKFGVIDILNGGTWLGKFFLEYNNGDEYFLNQYEDSILIKTQANLNDSWTICSKNGIDYIGTISLTGQQTIDGILDSTKLITIQAMQSSIPVANYYNNLSITLSKNHGFIECFELFGFPDKITPTFDSFSVVYPFPYLPLKHSRIENIISDTKFNLTDFTFKFKPGNEWIFYYAGNINTDYVILHDSIINSILINPTAIEVTRYRHTFTNYKIFPTQQAPYDTFYHTYSTFVDTVFQPINPISVKKLTPEHKNLLTGVAFDLLSYKIQWQFIDTFCMNKIVIKDTLFNQTPLSGSTNSSNKYIAGFDLVDKYLFTNPGMQGQYEIKNTIYLKLDFCTEGIKLNFRGLSIDDFTLNNKMISLYPNPSSREIYFTVLSDLKIDNYAISDISGKIIQENKYTSSINIQHLPIGYYVIQLFTDKGIVNKKFIKQ